MDGIVEDKNLLRKSKLAQRREYGAGLTQDKKAELSLQIVDNLFDKFDFAGRSIIASYVALADEVDVAPMNSLLAEIGLQVAFPRIEADKYLSFRCPDHIDHLEVGSFGVHQPPAHSHIVYPEVYLVPLVAFDESCHRIGYGQGHYDRVLRESSHTGNILAIGIAYDMQKVNEIPAETTDHQLDYVVTEKQVYRALK